MSSAVDTALAALHRDGRLEAAGLAPEVAQYLQPLLDAGVLRRREHTIVAAKPSLVAAILAGRRSAPAVENDVVVCRTFGPWAMSWPDSHGIDLMAATAAVGVAAFAVGADRWPRYPGPVLVITDQNRFLSEDWGGRGLGLVILAAGKPTEGLIRWLSENCPDGQRVQYEGPLGSDWHESEWHEALRNQLGDRLVEYENPKT